MSTTPNDIVTFFHCKKCLEELPPGMSPREYIHIEAGYTILGIQTWCIRHEENIIHLDFLTQKVAIAIPPPKLELVTDE